MRAEIGIADAERLARALDHGEIGGDLGPAKRRPGRGAFLGLRRGAVGQAREQLRLGIAAETKIITHPDVRWHAPKAGSRQVRTRSSVSRLVSIRVWPPRQPQKWARSGGWRRPPV